MFLLILGCSTPFGLDATSSPGLDEDGAPAAWGMSLAEAAEAQTETPAQEEEAPGDTGWDTGLAEPALSQDELDALGEPGSWAVGVRTVTLWDQSRWRSIPVEVWYPVDPEDPDGSDNSYELELLGLTLYEMETPARRDATPASGDFPAVLFSHGYGGIRFQSWFLTEHLASHGFVVVAPDHPGNTLSEVWNLGSDEAAWQSSEDRPLDLGYALDALEDGSLGVSADTSRVGITGHSFGGWAAIQTPLLDGRFTASFPMAPGFRETASPEMSAELGMPFLVIGGSQDATCEFDENQRATYDAAADPKYLARIEGAGHLDFSNLCEIDLARLFVDDGCNDDNIAPSEVQDRSRWLATAFAKAWVEGDARYLDALAEDPVTALGKLSYWSQD